MYVQVCVCAGVCVWEGEGNEQLQKGLATSDTEPLRKGSKCNTLGMGYSPITGN